MLNFLSLNVKQSIGVGRGGRVDHQNEGQILGQTRNNYSTLCKKEEIERLLESHIKSKVVIWGKNIQSFPVGLSKQIPSTGIHTSRNLHCTYSIFFLGGTSKVIKRETHQSQNHSFFTQATKALPLANVQLWNVELTNTTFSPNFWYASSVKYRSSSTEKLSALI